MDTRPIQASQLIFPSVRMLARAHEAIAATATKTAVHVPCADTALRPMEMPNMAEPAMKIQSVRNEC